jgi:hypothetical protein
VRTLRLATCVVISTAVLVSGCASRSATITGTLEVGNGACVWVRAPDANGSHLYWLRQLPSGYDSDEQGLVTPDRSHIRIGDSLTVSGALSWLPFERNCDGTHTLDVEAIT